MNVACKWCGERTDLPAGTAEDRLLTICTHCYNPILAVRLNGDYRSDALPKAPDLRALAPEGSIGGALLHALKLTADSLPVLPEISMKAMKAMENPAVGMNQLADVIREDSVIAGQVLRAANSALYGGLSEITELDVACARLGTRTVSNIIQTVANANLFSSKNKVLRDKMTRLWTHSVIVAFCASEIARIVSEPRAERLYLAGLFHDIGKTAILRIVDGARAKPLAALKESPELLQEVLDNFHALVGLFIVLQWRLPQEFGVTVFFHDDVNHVPNESWLRPIHIVSLANAIAKVSGYALEATGEPGGLLSHPSAVYLGMTDIRLANIRVDVEEKFEGILELFGIVS